MRKFLEISHGSHHVAISRKPDDGGQHTFVLEVSLDDLNALSIALARLVDDPTKLAIEGELPSDHKERALQLGIATHEMAQRLILSRHDRPWHRIIPDSGLVNEVTDTEGALIAMAYAADTSNSFIDDDEDDRGEPPPKENAPGPMLPPGTVIIDA